MLSLFPSRVAVYAPEDVDELRQELLARLVAEASAEPGIAAANRGGWHSVPDIARRREPVYQAYCQMIVAHVRRTLGLWAQEAGKELPPFGVMLHAWAMVMRDGDYTVLHDHGDAHICGPYYLDVGDTPDDPDSGAISFTDPRRASSRILGLDLFGSSITLQPQAGQLVLFPGYLEHHVHPYRGQRPRVCIANNAIIVPEAPLTLPGGRTPLGFTSPHTALE